MKYFLVKTEPSTYSLANLKTDKQTFWDGVKNPLALKILTEMETGDKVFIYHSGKETSIVGLAKVIKPAKDKTQSPKLAFLQSFKNPITLSFLKTKAIFKTSPLIRIGRLSVMPISEAQAKLILKQK